MYNAHCVNYCQDFLMLDEYTSLKNGERSSISQESVNKCFITCNKTTVGWESSNNVSTPKNEEITLENVTFTVKTGQVLAIIGPVGSGKVSVMYFFCTF